MAEHRFPTRRTHILPPDFNRIPQVLRDRPYWCFWREKKIPTRLADGAIQNGSIKAPSDWQTYHEAVERYHAHNGWGIGMLLNGDGLIAIDIDGCVHGGEPSPESLAVMREHGVGYVEFSPSATGLHGYGFADLRAIKKTRFSLCGICVEIYAHSRFMTVTGHVLWDTGIKDLPLLVDALQSHATEDTEDKEDIECHSSGSSGSSVASIQIAGRTYKMPRFAQPTGFGQRNEDLFHLARWIKGIDAALDKKGRYYCVAQWHQQFLDVIRTKDLNESVADFENAWRNVKKPHGERLKQAASRMNRYEAPAEVIEMGVTAVRLFQLLASVADLSRPQPFFLACSTAAEELDCDVSTVSRRLNDFIHIGVIKLHEEHTPRKARRFTMVTKMSSIRG